MTQINPIFAKELDAFEEATKCFDIASTCRPIIKELLLAALQRASLAVVEESVKINDKYIPNAETTGCTKDETYCYRDGYKQSTDDTLATAREEGREKMRDTLTAILKKYKQENDSYRPFAWLRQDIRNLLLALETN